jgi:opacity protein-like surface antigen
MKNKLLIFSLLSALSLGIKAQVIENNLHFQFSYGIVNTMGDKNTNEDGFVLPSLYANYSKGSQLSFRTTYKLRPVWSFGAEFNQTKFEGWEYGKGEGLFNNSTSTLTRVGILLKIHTKFRQEGFYNKTQLYAILSPFYNNVKLTLQQPTFSFQPEDIILLSKIERSSHTWGMNSGIGMIYSVTQRLSLFAEGGLIISRVESQLHNDKFIKASYLDFGLCFQFIKSKSLY